MRAKFVTVEGLDGAGKTTHLEWLERTIAGRGVSLRRTREPGGTPLGEKLRDLLLHGGEEIHPETEVLLMFAARREHIERVIRPALESGIWVLCDRFTDASYAYQSGGSGVPWQKVETLERWAQGDLQPDLTVYFDVDPEIGRTRTRAVRTPDRFEREQAAFHAAVRAAYLRRAREHPQRIRVIDANRSLEEIRAELGTVIDALFSDGSDRA